MSLRQFARLAGLGGLATVLVACGASRPTQPSWPVKPAAPLAKASPVAPATAPVASPPKPAAPPPPEAVPAPSARYQPEVKKGGYYLDDGPAAQIPENLDRIPDAEPKLEALNRNTMRPYSVFGKLYAPHSALKPFRQRGVASWYGKKFHGQKTSSGEPYDMFAMTAAHTVLPIPSYVRVSNPANGRSVIVRVNDRGPFHADRIIDLSYTAAQKLGYVDRGSTEVEVEQILPGGVSTYAQLAPPRKSAGKVEPAPALSGRELDEMALLIGRLESAPGERPAATKGDDPATGVYLQLGAFGNPDNAENLRLHLARELDWLADKMRVYPAAMAGGGTLHRLQAGPYASRTLAEQAAARVGEAMGSRPALVVR